MKIVIIGAVAAGMSAAAKARRVNPAAEILVLEKGADISYGACGLPYFVSGLNPEAERLKVRSLEEFAKSGITVRTHSEVTGLDAAAKTLTVQDLSTGKNFIESYDRLMIATGAAAARPPLPGAHLAHTLKTYTDGLTLEPLARAAQNIVVAGGGYIGVEVAESLAGTGKNVRVIEAADHILDNFDPEIREKLARRMAERGIALHLGEPMTEVLEKDGVAAGVGTAKGEYPADLVIMALGVKPATGFLAGTGIDLAANGAIVVDRHQRTSLPDVWSAGDCTLAYNRVENRDVYSPLGTVANKCGRVAGTNMADPTEGGGTAKFEGCLGSVAVLVCGWEAARTGMGEKAARQLVGDVQTVSITASDRPRYYPGQTDVHIKLICEAGTKRILGGQTLGEKGAVLRADVIAAAITAGMTAYDLGWLDFCYAPPFAEAWDALNIAGNAVK